MARPSKYTPPTVERLCQAIRLGATYALAAKSAGVSYQTFNVWREQKPEFSEALEKAEGDAAVTWLEKIEQAATSGEWQAAAWKLERRYPRDYGRRLQEVSGPDGGPIPLALIDRVVRDADAP